VSKHSASLADVEGFWTGACHGDSCKVIRFTSELTFTERSSAAAAGEKTVLALCSVSGDASNDFRFMYTCQCKNNYGYENCTEAQYDSSTTIQVHAYSTMHGFPHITHFQNIFTNFYKFVLKSEFRGSEGGAFSILSSIIYWRFSPIFCANFLHFLEKNISKIIILVPD
jgi:hypothetical protein